MKFGDFFNQITPDAVETVRRFTVVIAWVGLATFLLVVLINDWAFVFETEVWERAAFGSFTAAVFALAGNYFAEGHPTKRKLSFVLSFPLPLIIFLLAQVRGDQWVFLALLPVVSLFWLSVSPFTQIARGAERIKQQDVFWWVNHRAITSGIIAFVAVVVIGIGTVAIERSLSVLFNVDVQDLFYQIILPVLFGFFAPFYWLSTLPRLSDFEPEDLKNPDFLSNAVGFLGQFILTPLLIAYALILFAYAAQIAVLRALPEGTLGWMVLGFSIVGAVNMLVLYPSFMQTRLLVRLFRRYWFLATLLPLAVYFLAVGIRVDTYGLTPQRVLLIVGGIWASILAVLFIIPKCNDIRLIPAVAGIGFALCAIGPWNASNLATVNQASRLSSALEVARVSGSNSDPVWTIENASVAKSALRYLRENADEEFLTQLFDAQNIVYNSETDSYADTVAILGIPDAVFDAGERSFSLNRADEPHETDVSATPIYLGSMVGYSGGELNESQGFAFQLVGATLQFYSSPSSEGDETIGEVDLSIWLTTQIADEKLTEPFFDFSIGAVRYRVIVSQVYVSLDGSEGAEFPLTIRNLDGQLFRSAFP